VEVQVTGDEHVASGSRWPALLWATGAVPLVAAALHAVVLTGVAGPWVEALSLRRPTAHAGTGWLLAWATALLLPRVCTRAWERHVIGGGVVLFAVVETAVAGLRLWRGLPTRTYLDRPPDAALMQVGAIGVGAVLLMSGIVLLVATVRTRGLPLGARAGVLAGAGLLLSGCALGLMTMATGGAPS
jgi:hypothetical protein